MSLSKNIGKCRKCGFPMYQCKCHFNTIAEPMSKEKTLTAEEWMEEMGLPTNRTVANIAEEYAKAKVLEALEREVTIAYNAGKEYEAYKRMDLDPYTFGSEYYETEVKPKYKL